MVEGKSEREVAQYFGIHRKIVKKMRQYTDAGQIVGAKVGLYRPCCFHVVH